LAERSMAPASAPGHVSRLDLLPGYADYLRKLVDQVVSPSVLTVAAVAEATAQVKAAFAGRPGVSTDELDGLTVAASGWWFNLRPSNTEPLLRLNVEADTEATMAALRDEVLGLVRAGLVHAGLVQPAATGGQASKDI